MVPVLYVHGAGAQPPAEELRQTLDAALFRGPRPPTSVAYYADICWPPASPSLAAASSGPGGAPVADLASVIAAMAPGQTREAAARAVLAAASGFASAPPASTARGARSRRPRGQEADPRAVQLMEAFIESADRAASAARARSAAPPDTTPGPSRPAIAPEGIELLEPVLRAVAAGAGVDVIRYLCEPAWRQPMRARVRDAFAATPDPCVIIAHSLGAIIAYDVLSDPALAERDVRLLATIGSPLGISAVMTRLRDGLGPGTVPTTIESWANFCDTLDPVAILGKTLSDKFAPFDFVHDVTDLDNPAANNHDLPGYFGLQPIREAVWRAVRAF